MPLILRKTLVVVAATALGLLVLQRGLALYFGSTLPALSLQLQGSDARALVTRGDELLKTPLDPVARRDAAALARRALDRDPTRFEALRILGVLADFNGDHARALRLMRQADRVTRRDLELQLWWIEHLSKQDASVDATLYRYDLALRTSMFAPSILFPVLISAVSDPAISDGLIKILATRPVWSAALQQQLVRDGRSDAASTRVLTKLMAKGAADPLALTEFQEVLRSRREYRLAWPLYHRAHPAAQVGTIQNGGFESSDDTPNPFAWRLATGPGIFGEIASPGLSGRGALRFRANRGTGGVIAEQAILTSPGRYRFGGLIGPSPKLGSSAMPFWAIKCVEDDRQIARIPLPVPNDAGTRFSGTFEVPAGCNAVIVSLSLPPSDEDEISGTIDNVQMERVI